MVIGSGHSRQTKIPSRHEEPSVDVRSPLSCRHDMARWPKRLWIPTVSGVYHTKFALFKISHTSRIYGGTAVMGGANSRYAGQAPHFCNVKQPWK
eukprot:357806-Chlamydomonas_euryale.AAC.12